MSAIATAIRDGLAARGYLAEVRQGLTNVGDLRVTAVFENGAEGDVAYAPFGREVTVYVKQDEAGCLHVPGYGRLARRAA